MAIGRALATAQQKLPRFACFFFSLRFFVFFFFVLTNKSICITKYIEPYLPSKSNYHQSNLLFCFHTNFVQYNWELMTFCIATHTQMIMISFASINFISKSDNFCSDSLFDSARLILHGL